MKYCYITLFFTVVALQKRGDKFKIKKAEAVPQWKAEVSQWIVWYYATPVGAPGVSTPAENKHLGP